MSQPDKKDDQQLLLNLIGNINQIANHAEDISNAMDEKAEHLTSLAIKCQSQLALIGGSKVIDRTVVEKLSEEIKDVIEKSIQPCLNSNLALKKEGLEKLKSIKEDLVHIEKTGPHHRRK